MKVCLEILFLPSLHHSLQLSENLTCRKIQKVLILALLKEVFTQKRQTVVSGGEEWEWGRGLKLNHMSWVT